MANGTTTQPTAGPTQTAGGSVSDVLTTLKNLVTGLANLTQQYLNVEGAQNFAALTVPTVVKSSSGRVARVSVIVAGSATGFIYDGGSLSATAKPLWVIPTTVGVYEVNLPTSFGLLVSPGTGQTVSGSWS
jgi:cysteine synthase